MPHLEHVVVLVVEMASDVLIGLLAIIFRSVTRRYVVLFAKKWFAMDRRVLANPEPGGRREVADSASVLHSVRGINPYEPTNMLF